MNFPAGILFDMDGTLTEPLLDFPMIKSEMGIRNQSILEALADMNEADRHAAETILHRHEESAAARSTLNPGCRELLDWLGEMNLATALITRNSRASVLTVLSRHELQLRLLITRDDAPPKPDPAPLLLACREMGLPTSAVWMVGDGVYDVEAGNATGIRTVWISHGRNRSFEARPDCQVMDLHELLRLLKSLASESAKLS